MILRCASYRTCEYPGHGSIGAESYDFISRLDIFHQHAPQIGWFLNDTRFSHAALLPYGNINRPLPALLSVVYLWGTFFARLTSNNEIPNEQLLLSRARTQIGHSMPNMPSHRILQTIQTYILLATYLFVTGNYLEGRQYCNFAASLVMSCGLQKIRTEQLDRGFSTSIDAIDLTLPEPHDQIEEGERINAFWTTFLMDRCWAIALQTPTIISDSDVYGAQIDTPWPLEMETYERVCHPAPFTV